MNAEQLHLMRNMCLENQNSDFKELARIRKIARWNDIDISLNDDKMS